MRQALNSNPMVQLGVLGVVGVVFAILMFTVVLKKEEAPAGPQQPSAKDLLAESGAAGVAPTTPAPAPAPPAEDSIPTPTPEAAAAPAPTAPSSGAVDAAEELVPGKGLPKDVVAALAEGKAVALLVVDSKGVSDKRIDVYTKRLGERDDVEAVVVNSEDIADYSRLTLGVSVSRSPALVIVRAAGPGSAERVATVAYGFRGSKSMETALEGALYEGGTVPPWPE